MAKAKSIRKITPKNTVWTLPELKRAAKQFPTRRRFFEGNPGAYRAALRRGIMDDICGHMVSVNGRPKSTIMNKTQVRAALKNYTRIKDIVAMAPQVLRSAKHHDMMDEVKATLKKNRG